jgi:hypothetical protein
MLQNAIVLTVVLVFIRKRWKTYIAIPDPITPSVPLSLNELLVTFVLRNDCRVRISSLMICQMRLRHHFTFLLCLFALALALGSCGRSAKDRKISPDSVDGDIASIKETGELTADETRLLDAFVQRAKFGGMFTGASFPKDKTVGDMIEDQRQWEAQRRMVEGQTLRSTPDSTSAQSTSGDSYAHTVDVRLIDKSFLPSSDNSSGGQDVLLLKFSITNLTNRPIRGVAGSLVFSDTAGAEIARMDFANDEMIPARKTIEWADRKTYNQFSDGDKNLNEADLSTIKTDWTVEKVVYADSRK